MKNTRDFAFELKASGDQGQFTGYGNVYGIVDDGDDIVQAGAFAESLADWQSKGRMPPVLWQHSSRDPIGAYTAISEDGTGLRVQGQLCMDTQRGKEAFALLKMSAISGLSIGFMTREDSFDQKTGVRTIKKADLWECSLVTFPQNDAARVSTVKAIENITDLKSAERYLREDCGLSRSEATAFMSRIKGLGQSDSAADEAAKREIEQKLRSELARMFQPA